MQNGGGGGIPMEELQRQQQGLTDPEGQGWVFSMKLIDALSFYMSKMILYKLKTLYINEKNLVLKQGTVGEGRPVNFFVSLRFLYKMGL